MTCIRHPPRSPRVVAGEELLLPRFSMAGIFEDPGFMDLLGGTQPAPAPAPGLAAAAPAAVPANPAIAATLNQSASEVAAKNTVRIYLVCPFCTNARPHSHKYRCGACAFRRALACCVF